ncbi:ribonuclease H-like domain-containing protein [Tanacetum coccineum]
MALPNEHQLTFNQYVDAQSMFAAIKARFGGNEATKRTQKALLKQQYENFNASSSESLDSIFNRLQKLVKRSTGAINDEKNLAFLTTTGASSINNINTVNPEVSTGTTKVNTASTETSTASFRIKGSQVDMANTMHGGARKFYPENWKGSHLDGSSTAGYDKSKGSFIKGEGVRIEDASKKEICAIDGAGFDWSDIAEEEIQVNMALMAFSDSEVTNDKSCSKSCLQNYEALKKQYDDLLVKLDDTGFKASTYQRGLSILEGQILKYKEYEVLFFEEIALLKRSVGLEEFKQPEVNEYGPRDSSLKPTTGCDKESDNSKENTDDSLKQQQKTDSSSVKVDKDWKENFFCPANHVREEEPKKARENNDAPIIEDWVSDDEDDVEPIPKSSLNKDWPKKTVKNCKAFNNVRSVNTDRRFSTAEESNSQLNDKGFIDSGCSRHMTGNIAHLSDFKDFDGGYVTFGGGAYGGRITGTGTIKTGNLDFDDVFFVKELKFNLFSVSQMCDKKNYVLFTDSECLVLSPNFKLPDENQILLKIPRQDNMYSFDMKNIVPKDCLTCLVAKATSEESMLWHRRLGHINFKNINKLVKENLVRDLPLKRFENDQTCVACLKGKQQQSLYNLGKFDEKSDEENKPMIEGNGPKWLFDLDSLTQSMNYVPVVARKSSNDFAGIQGVSESSTSSQQDQDWIVMPIWKDASYFGDASPKTVDVNTVRPNINTGSREVSTALPEVITTTPEDLVGSSPASKDSHVEDQEIKLGNIPSSIMTGFRSLVQDGDADDVDEHLYRSMDRLFDVPYSNPVRYHVAVCDMCKFSGFSKVFSILLAADLLAKARKQNVVPTSTTKAELCQLQVDVDSSLDPKPSCLDNWYKLYEYHNMVAFLEKSTGSAGFHQVIDFLNRNHICYALTKKPAVSVSFIKQLRSAEASTDDNGEVKIIATIDGHSLSITEGSLRRHSN